MCSGPRRWIWLVAWMGLPVGLNTVFGPSGLVALPLTALLALVLDADPWFVSLAIQAESFIKCPICLWRIRSRKWIHDVTLPEGER